MRQILLWESGAPGMDPSIDQPEPDLLYYPAEGGGNTAIVICAGGGYRIRNDEGEGIEAAVRLAAKHYHAFVLRYRISPYTYPTELNDVLRAMRVVRSLAPELGYGADRIGIGGFSAGGHLAVMAGEHFDSGLEDGDEIDRQPSRPDFVILGYPAAGFVKPYGNSGTASRLLGENRGDIKLRYALTGECNVPEGAPPFFIWHAFGDRLVDMRNSLDLAAALREKNVPVELHIFREGGHGLPFEDETERFKILVHLIGNWLRVIGFAPEAGTDGAGSAT